MQTNLFYRYFLSSTRLKSVNITTVDCSQVTCNCVGDRCNLEIGRSRFDIEPLINAADGYIKLDFENSTNAVLTANVLDISGFFPEGINVTTCSHGECINPTTNLTSDVVTLLMVRFSLILAYSIYRNRL